MPKPNPPLAPQLHHLALGARDVEGLASFYRDVLLLPELSRQRHVDGSLRAVWLGLGGGAVLMLEATANGATSASATNGAESGAAHGLFLLALSIAAEDRTAWEERLARAGAAVDARTEATSYARDPEGNRIAVSFYPLPHSPAHTAPGSTSP